MEVLLRRLLLNQPEALARWTYARFIKAMLIPVQNSIVREVAEDIRTIGMGEVVVDFDVLLVEVLAVFTPTVMLDDYQDFLLAMADQILADPDVLGSMFAEPPTEGVV